MSTKCTNGRISEKLKRLNKKKNLILLAANINQGDVSVSSVAKKIADISRLDRSYLRLYLSEEGKRKFDWAWGKIISRRRKELGKAISKRNEEDYLSQFGWLEKLELIDGKSKETERLIKKSVKCDVCKEVITPDYIDIVKCVNAPYTGEARLKETVKGMRPCEKQVINDIYIDSILSGDPKQVLRDLRKNLSILPDFIDFFDDDFLFKTIKCQVSRLVGFKGKDFGTYTYKGITSFEMNEKSSNIITNALLASSPKVAYAISILNIFQSLDVCDDDKNPIKYSFESHAVTVGYLKMLARRGIVEIEKLDYTGTVDLSGWYEALGNKPRTRYPKSYKVVFSKNRDLDVGDAEWLRKKMDALGIPGWEMFLGFGKNYKMFAYLSSFGIRRCITNGTFDENLAKMEKVFAEMLGEDGKITTSQDGKKTMKMKKVSKS